MKPSALLRMRATFVLRREDCKRACLAVAEVDARSLNWLHVGYVAALTAVLIVSTVLAHTYRLQGIALCLGIAAFLSGFATWIVWVSVILCKTQPDRYWSAIASVPRSLTSWSFDGGIAFVGEEYRTDMEWSRVTHLLSDDFLWVIVVDNAAIAWVPASAFERPADFEAFKDEMYAEYRAAHVSARGFEILSPP
ncbi:MAG TPA: YcxB family protein [Tepidisphaeraceae bacterium]